MSEKVTTNKVVGVSLLVDLSDFVLNLAVAIISGSTTMLAESLQGLSDLVTVFFVWLGVKRSKKRANKDFHFGFGREVYFWTIVSGFLMLFVTAALSFYFGYKKFINSEPIGNLPLALAILLLGLATNYYAFRLSVKRLMAGHKGQRLWKTFIYSGLVEIKNTFVLDLMGMVSALSGLVALTAYAVTGDNRYDGLGAMTIAVFIAIFAIILIRGVKDLIVGKSADLSTIEEIKTFTEGVSGVTGITDIKTMHIGAEKLLVNIDITLDKSIEGENIGKVIESLQGQLKDKIKTIRHIQIEVQ